MINKINKAAEALFMRLVGIGGGLICAGSACVVILYAYKVFSLSFTTLILCCIVFTTIFPILGLIKYKYFCWFILPFVIACNYDFDTCDKLRGWREPLATVILTIALLALSAGALGGHQVGTPIGTILFLSYAICIPQIFRERLNEAPE